MWENPKVFFQKATVQATSRRTAGKGIPKVERALAAERWKNERWKNDRQFRKQRRNPCRRRSGGRGSAARRS